MTTVRRVQARTTTTGAEAHIESGRFTRPSKGRSSTVADTSVCCFSSVSNHAVMRIGGLRAEYCCAVADCYAFAGMGCPDHDAGARANAGTQARGTFRLSRRRVSRVAYRTGEHRNSGGVRTSAGYGEIGGTGSGINCARRGSRRNAGFFRRFRLSSTTQGNLRSAAGSLCPWKRGGTDSARHRDGGDAASHALRFGDGGATGV